MISSDIRKSVLNNLSIKGVTLLIIDICFALWIIPSVPVILNFNCVASFLAFKSSRINNTSSNSTANAKALASPASIWVSKNSWYFLSETDRVLIQLGRFSPNYLATSGVVIISPYTFCKRLNSSILSKSINALASETTILGIFYIGM